MHTLHRFAALATLIGAGMLSYGIAGQLLGAYDLREVGRVMIAPPPARYRRPPKRPTPTKA